MLSEQEERFIQYWSVNGERQKTSIRPFLVGMSSGFVVGVMVLIVLSSGWYERANMVANTRFNSVVFILAILIISFFMAFLYRKFRWEIQDQQYRELLAKKSRQKNQPEAAIREDAGSTT